MSDIDTLIVGYIHDNPGCGLYDIGYMLREKMPQDYERVLHPDNASRNRALKRLKTLIKFKDVQVQYPDDKTAHYYTKW